MVNYRDVMLKNCNKNLDSVAADYYGLTSLHFDHAAPLLIRLTRRLHCYTRSTSFAQA
jgi:hypothetical protein